MALGIAITPLAITATLLLLTTSRARSSGPAFIAGWIIGLVFVGGVALVVFGSAGADRSGAPPTWVSWLRIALGLLLMSLAPYELLRHRTSRTFTATPRWAGKLERIKPPIALGLGAALAGARPKNILLVVAGAAAIAGTGISAGQQGIAYAVFAGVATIGVAVPVVLYFVMGDDAPEGLKRMEIWMGDNAVPVTAVLCMVIGVDLIGRGIASLT